MLDQRISGVCKNCDGAAGEGGSRGAQEGSHGWFEGCCHTCGDVFAASVTRLEHVQSNAHSKWERCGREFETTDGKESTRSDRATELVAAHPRLVGKSRGHGKVINAHLNQCSRRWLAPMRPLGTD